MYPMVEQELSRQAELEAQRAGLRQRLLRQLETAHNGSGGLAPDVDIAIREALPTDLRELMHLAELDSRPMPVGHVLVAKVDGKLRAALSVDSGELVADPFVATAELEQLLRLRADQLHKEGRTPYRRSGLLAALHLRPA
jgi:hypothetical protein